MCLLGIYVQEYGSECPAPNTRRVYLYLDSVKYFGPSGIQVATGEDCALRTYYHQILIGYLQYVKQRGFTSCFIWACPVSGRGLALSATPRSRRRPRATSCASGTSRCPASAEGGDRSLGNLYDEFHLGANHIASATELPYFDGDYFPASRRIGSRASRRSS